MLKTEPPPTVSPTPNESQQPTYQDQLIELETLIKEAEGLVNELAIDPEAMNSWSEQLTSYREQLVELKVNEDPVTLQKVESRVRQTIRSLKSTVEEVMQQFEASINAMPEDDSTSIDISPEER